MRQRSRAARARVGEGFMGEFDSNPNEHQDRRKDSSCREDP
jgi:hypothetical protein